MVRPEGSILDAYFTGRSIALSGDLYQYDYGQILRFNNIDLPEYFEVHFSNHDSVGTSITIMCTNAQVAIPDKFLLTGLPIYFWVYLHDEVTDGETEYNATITVVARPKPEDYIQPVERDVIAQAIDALNVSAVEAKEAAVSAEHSEAMAKHYAEMALINAEQHGIFWLEMDDDTSPDGEMRLYISDGLQDTLSFALDAKDPDGELVARISY
jgi:hypothetical protein